MFHNDDIRVCNNDDIKVCYKDDIRVCHSDDVQVCYTDDLPVCKMMSSLLLLVMLQTNTGRVFVGQLVHRAMAS